MTVLTRSKLDKSVNNSTGLKTEISPVKPNYRSKLMKNFGKYGKRKHKDKTNWGTQMDILIVVGQLFPYLYVTESENSNSCHSIDTPETRC
jgi:hypothetical protein